MRKFILLCALVSAVPLASCAGIPTSPGDITAQTKIDEQLAVGADLAYKGFRLTVETGVQSGLIKGQLAARLADVDNRLFSAYTLVANAYEAGNSQSLASAIVSFNGILAEGNSLIARKGQ